MACARPLRVSTLTRLVAPGKTKLKVVCRRQIGLYISAFDSVCRTKQYINRCPVSWCHGDDDVCSISDQTISAFCPTAVSVDVSPSRDALLWKHVSHTFSDVIHTTHVFHAPRPGARCLFLNAFSPSLDDVRDTSDDSIDVIGTLEDVLTHLMTSFIGFAESASVQRGMKEVRKDES